MPNYAVDSVDGFSRDIVAANDAEARAEAARIVREDWPLNADTRYEVWDIDNDVHVFTGTRQTD